MQRNLDVSLYVLIIFREAKISFSFLFSLFSLIFLIQIHRFISPAAKSMDAAVGEISTPCTTHVPPSR